MNYVCLLQGAQAEKRVCRQSLQGCAAKGELPGRGKRNTVRRTPVTDTAPGAHDYMFEVFCVYLTSRRSVQKTRMPAESSICCLQGGVPCGGGERQTVRPVDTRSARAHTCKRKEQQQVDGKRAECFVLSICCLEGQP